LVVSDCLFGASRLLAVLGDLLRLAGDALREVLIERVGDPPVKFLSLAREQRLIGRVLHQGVLERVDRLRRKTALIEQLRLDQPPEAVA